MIVVRVEDDGEGIVAVEITVASEFGGEDPVRLAVSENRRDVESCLIVHDANGGGLGSRLSFVRIALTEIVDDRRSFPGRIVQTAVEDRRGGDSHCRQQRFGALGAGG